MRKSVEATKESEKQLNSKLQETRSLYESFLQQEQKIEAELKSKVHSTQNMQIEHDFLEEEFALLSAQKLQINGSQQTNDQKYAQLTQELEKNKAKVAQLLLSLKQVQAHAQNLATQKEEAHARLKLLQKDLQNTIRHNASTLNKLKQFQKTQSNVNFTNKYKYE